MDPTHLVSIAQKPNEPLLATCSFKLESASYGKNKWIGCIEYAEVATYVSMKEKRRHRMNKLSLQDPITRRQVRVAILLVEQLA